MGGRSSQIAAVATVILCTAFLTSCGELPRDEVSRSPSPGGNLDAVIAEVETDATVATPTEVYVLAHGQPLSGQALFRADYVDGIEVTWSQPNVLTIRAARARVFLRPDEGRGLDVDGVGYSVVLDIKDNIAR